MNSHSDTANALENAVKMQVHFGKRKTNRTRKTGEGTTTDKGARCSADRPTNCNEHYVQQDRDAGRRRHNTMIEGREKKWPGKGEVARLLVVLAHALGLLSSKRRRHLQGRRSLLRHGSLRLNEL